MNVKRGVHEMNTAISMKQFVILYLRIDHRSLWPPGDRSAHTHAGAPMPTPRLLYLVTEDWYFVSHRLPMARAAREAGFEVHVATRVVGHGQAIAREGFALHPLDWKRGSTNPLAMWNSVRAVRTLYRVVRPDLVHHVALQPAIVGSMAALGLPIAVISAVTGLGATFTAETSWARIVRGVMSGLMRWLFNRPDSTVLVQNPDDQAALAALGVSPERIVRIPGSGVDTERLAPLPEPPGPPVAAFVGRLLETKGVPTLMQAYALLAERGSLLRLLIAGDPDPANATSVKPALLAQWRERPGVEFLGHVPDIRTVWEQAHIAVLPSRGGEGLPLSLLEAAACGRPIVATDVPGSREVARAGVNAILVPADDPGALAEALSRLAADPDLRARYGAASRRLAETEFSSARIGREIVALYRRALEGRLRTIGATSDAAQHKAPTP
jgi:glycosyltransferase involved in cell wall biosynthesis